MLKFRFAGHLRRHFRQVELNVETPAQGLRLLLAQSQPLKRDFLNTRIRMRVAGDDVTEETLSMQMDRKLPDGSTVLFVPVIEGAITGTAALVATLIIAAASVAYSIYMARNMKTKTSAEAADTNSITNNSFTSAENLIGQGRPVPILLGEMEVGSNVISLGIDTSNNMDWVDSIS